MPMSELNLNESILNIKLSLILCIHTCKYVFLVSFHSVQDLIMILAFIETDNWFQNTERIDSSERWGKRSDSRLYDKWGYLYYVRFALSNKLTVRINHLSNEFDTTNMKSRNHRYYIYLISFFYHFSFE